MAASESDKKLTALAYSGKETGGVAAYVPHTAHLGVVQVATNVGIPMLFCLARGRRDVLMMCR